MSNQKLGVSIKWINVVALREKLIYLSFENVSSIESLNLARKIDLVILKGKLYDVIILLFRIKHNVFNP